MSGRADGPFDTGRAEGPFDTGHLWPFDTVLIANRGEIACRIQRTVHALGLRSVAVYSDADRGAPHVAAAHAAVRLGPAPAAASYLRVDAVIEAALATGAGAIHPGYGLLSESAELALACEESGIAFVGPTAEQLRLFGLKHTARDLARRAGVPLIPGSGLLASADEAVAAADAVGWPVMLKATAGGGGIGMRPCRDADELVRAFAAVERLAADNFGQGGLFLERLVARARHVEVQVFGDGAGRVVALGERDCSAQRRNQKIVEETPAPGISPELRAALARWAVDLTAQVGYRSAGTVELVVDADRPDLDGAWFLEVNTRLQVEHGVTEAVCGIDLVAWMLRLAAGDPMPELDDPPRPRGAAIEARLYAEDPADDFRPCAGLLTRFDVPAGVRCDTWVAEGTEVTPYYDPLLAKLIVAGDDREGAVAAMAAALDATRVGGIETNLRFLADLVADERFRAGRFATADAVTVAHRPASVRVIEPGLFTTVQDLPGRVGYWQVGVPPSGPMDGCSFALVNRLVGNPEGAPGLEITLTGPTLAFTADIVIALGGAELPALLTTPEGDGTPVPWWTAVAVPAGARLTLGAAEGPGARAYLAVAGGFDVPLHLGSAATFVLGGFGGHGGRTLRPGDVLHLAAPAAGVEPGATLAPAERPSLTADWTIGVLAGPHGAPDFFTPGDIEALYATAWEVHFNSDRTGVRLIGPAPTWARPDGGEAGLHPSNIHDNAYAVGSIDFTGDMPIVLGPDGPSLGGFVCPATVASAERWKLGQLRAGDRVTFVPVTHAATGRILRPEDPVMGRLDGGDGRPGVVYRRSGDRQLLVEYGDNVLDLELRLRVGALMERLEAGPPPGLGELVPGIRSLQVGFDPDRISPDRLVGALREVEENLGGVDDLELPSRIVHLPLSWDDPATRLATEKYMNTVRPDAPWCPWNLEFIRRVNGLDSVEDVRRIVFDASYLVLGLGDVYLGAPVATPVDPRHRLVTTKYNPARTWTAENSVGIGGAYLCIYGMEGPGGYQFVGRTTQVWSRWRHGEPGSAFERPWLLRFFDQIRWYPVEAEELLDLRADVAAGRYPFRFTETTFSLARYRELLAGAADGIAEFTATRDAAFAAERRRWAEAGLELPTVDAGPLAAADEAPVPPGQLGVTVALAGMVWRCPVAPGDRVMAGEPVLVVESMKMESEVKAAVDGVVTEVRCTEGTPVQAGQVVVVLEPA
ncbi:MAG: 5-oxoprolinase/urea amidolyase family protein [Acidimicrobiales bacterium]